MPASRRRVSAALVPLLILLAACDGTGAVPGGTREVRYVVVGDADVAYAGSGGTAQAVTSGTWEYRFVAAPGAALAVEATSTGGAPVVAQIEVAGALLRADDGLHVRLYARLNDDGSTGEAEVQGPIAARGADRLTVLGFTFVVDGATTVRDYGGVALPFAALKVGDFVEVHARPRGDGTLLAVDVKREDGAADEVEVHGPIEALDAASVTVRGLRFTTDAATRWLDDDDNPVDPATFAVGDFVEAEGRSRGDGTLYAEKVKRDDD